MRRKKLLPVACAALMACQMIGGIPPLRSVFDTALPVSAEQETGNKCGDDATYVLDSNGVLTITGTGSIYEEFFNNGAGSSIINDIKVLVIGEGITGIGAKAFQSCSNLTVVNLPASLTSIGSDAFFLCFMVDDVFCYADPDNLAWNDYWADDFKYDNETRIHVLSEHLEKYKTAYSDPNMGSGSSNTNVRGEFSGDLSPEKKIVVGFAQGTPATCVQTGVPDKWTIIDPDDPSSTLDYSDAKLTVPWVETIPVDKENGHNWVCSKGVIIDPSIAGSPGKIQWHCTNEGCGEEYEEEYDEESEYSPKFTVTIPSAVTLDTTVSMELEVENGIAIAVILEKANGVDVTEGQTEFALYSDDDHQAEVDYSVTVQKYDYDPDNYETPYTQSEGTYPLSKDNPLLLADATNTSADAKDSAELTFTGPLDSVPYSGDYKGTLTFRIYSAIEAVVEDPYY